MTGKNGGALSVGSNSNIQLNESLMAITSPFSIARDEDLGAVSIESEDELDSDDDGTRLISSAKMNQTMATIVFGHDCVFAFDPIASGAEARVRLSSEP